MTSKATIGSAAKERDGLNPERLRLYRRVRHPFVPGVHGVLDYL